jgi:long-chain fatty acid transport protein
LRASSNALAIIAVLSCLFPARAFPTNGLNMIGFGSESIGMGGADLAVARDTTALNTNPAGLAQIKGSRLDWFGAYAYPIEVAHRDRFGNDAEVSNRSAFLAGGGYAGRLGGTPVTIGIGLFAQGGAGNVYKNLATPFGTRDELSSLFRIAKLSPGGAYKIGDSLSLGASVQVVYADIRQKVFPETSFVDPSDPSVTFFGLESNGMKGISAGYKVGALYRIGERVAIGAAYTNRIPIHLEDGEIIVNMSAVGLGKVTYRDARIEGLSLPQELGLGISMRPVKSLLLAAEVTWLDWSRSLRSSTLRASNPDNPSAPPTLESTSVHNWRDQYVFALGLAWDATDRFMVRAGYNYGRNPIPAETMNPLLAVHGEHHVTLGGGYVINSFWRTDLAVEYSLNNKVTYNNPNLPFGPGAQEEGEAIAFHLMVSRAW